MNLQETVEHVNTRAGMRLAGCRFEVNVDGDVVLNTFGRRKLSSFDIVVLNVGKGIIDKKAGRLVPAQTSTRRRNK